MGSPRGPRRRRISPTLARSCHDLFPPLEGVAPNVGREVRLACVLALPDEYALPTGVVEGGCRESRGRPDETRDVLVRIGEAGIGKRELLEERARGRV